MTERAHETTMEYARRMMACDRPECLEREAFSMVYDERDYPCGPDCCDATHATCPPEGGMTR